MPTTNNPGDYGIIFSGTTGTPGTYVDVNGQTQDQVQIAGIPVRMPAYVETAYVHTGRARRFTLQVDVTVNAESISINGQGHYNQDPTAAWGNVWLFANDDPATNTTTRTFSTSGTYLLQTANIGAVVEACVLATPNGDFEGELTIRLQVEP